MAKSSSSPATPGFRLTSPAIVALVGYAILIFIVLSPVEMFIFDEKSGQYVKQKYSFGYRALIALLLLFPFILSVYSVQCMVVGDCILWAILVVVAALTSGSFTLDQLA
jgi:hypothetical protein